MAGAICEGPQEQSRLKITNELRKFIEVDNGQAVTIGTDGLNVSGPTSTGRFPRTHEEVEWTLRAGDAGMLRAFINPIQCVEQKMGTPLVDEDRHAVCQAKYIGAEQAEWENLMQVCGGEQGDQRPQPRWKGQGGDALENVRGQWER